MRTACLDTRRSGLLTRRRRRTPEGVTFWTIEIPESVFKGAAHMPKLHKRLKGFARSLAQEALRIRAQKLLGEGTKPEAVAHELGLATSVVYKYKEKMNAQRS